ncbi:MAG: hypothetical protein NW224_28665 [Leptolyngbyaceae cyanobacterium bins.302]|nr:hypothetical protein [Leptolyngbyaceae cyanobacterium bins.302]
MTNSEFTQSLNLARALDLIISSRIVNGVLYVYTATGQARPWESFSSDFPLERLQAMANRVNLRQKPAN